METQNNAGRRSTDSERITAVEDKLLKCSVHVSDSISSLTERLESMQEALDRNTQALQKYNDSGLHEILKEHNDQKAFVEKSEGYGKRIIFLSKVGASLIGIAVMIGGVIAAIVYFAQNGQWPSGSL